MWALEEDGLLLGTQTRGLPVEDTNSDQISCALPGPGDVQWLHACPGM